MIRRLPTLCLALVLSALVGCAVPPPAAPRDATAPVDQWRGRLVVTHFTASGPSVQAGQFELGGNPQRGWLNLYSPMGQAVAELSWSAQGVIWKQSDRMQGFDRFEDWSVHWLGTSLPAQAWFDVLQGRPSPHPDWTMERPTPRRWLLIHANAPRVEIKLTVDEGPTP